MALLYFIAHPRSEVTPSLPVHEWQLSDQGIREARRLLELSWWSEVDTVFASPEPKALTVAQMAEVKFDLPIQLEECLRELDRQSGIMLEYDIFMAATKQIYATPEESIRGWERAIDAAERIFRCVKSCASSQPDSTIAVISHPMVGGLLHGHIRQAELSYDIDDPKSTARFFVTDLDQRRIVQDWTSY